MAFFDIYDSGGQLIGSCAPTYHGTYMQPAYLEVRSLAYDELKRMSVGARISWRDGREYRLYSLPNISQNAATAVGDKIVYESLQFFDGSKELEYALWRDVVQKDNAIHFSTQKDIATYETLDGIKRRIQSCLDLQYGSDQWTVVVADGLTDPSSEFYRPDIFEPREFSLSAGSTVLDALNQIYNTWDQIGWTFEIRTGIGYTVVIGGANVINVGNHIDGYAIGKGHGITSIKATLSNSSTIATRIYPFGNTTNLPVRHYNGKEIHNAESVDIQHLMIPVSVWGKTNGLPDASKAYLENAEAAAALGERPAVVYMDGDEYGDIYPSIEGMTAGDIRAGLREYQTDYQYLPSEDIYPDSERMDELKAVDGITDDGYNTIKDGTFDATTYDKTFSSSTVNESRTVEIGSASSPLFKASVTTGTYPVFTLSSAKVLEITYDTVPLYDEESCTIGGVDLFMATPGGTQQIDILDGPVVLNYGSDNSISVSIPSGISGAFPSSVGTSNATFDVSVWLRVNYVKNHGTIRMTASSANAISISIKNDNRKEQTGVILKQIGFDIADYSVSRGNYGYLAMKSGMCAGRSFKISSCKYNASSQTWELTVKRSYDKDIKQYFPNTAYPLSASDRFVLTDIRMPEIYIAAAEQRLYKRAKEVLDVLSTPVFVLEPSIDAKFVNEQDTILSFVPGNYFDFETDTFVDYYYSKFIDTVTITERDYAIPTVSITLRERKRKSFKNTINQSSSSSSSSSDSGSTVEENTSASGGGSVTVDTALSLTSANPVQNKVVSNALNQKADKGSFAKVATSGSYNDLSDTPTIPEGLSVDQQLNPASTDAVSNQAVCAGLSDVEAKIPTDYAKKSDIIKNTSGLNNDAGFVKKNDIATINGQSLTNGGDIIIEGGSGGGGNVNVLTKAAYDVLVSSGDIDETALYAVSAFAPSVPVGYGLPSDGFVMGDGANASFKKTVTDLAFTFKVNSVSSADIGIGLPGGNAIEYMDGTWQFDGIPTSLTDSDFTSGDLLYVVTQESARIENYISGTVYARLDSPMTIDLLEGGDYGLKLFSNGTMGHSFVLNGKECAAYVTSSGNAIVVDSDGEVAMTASGTTATVSGDTQSAMMYLGTKPIGGDVTSVLDSINGEEV